MDNGLLCQILCLLTGQINQQHDNGYGDFDQDEDGGQLFFGDAVAQFHDQLGQAADSVAGRIKLSILVNPPPVFARESVYQLDKEVDGIRNKEKGAGAFGVADDDASGKRGADGEVAHIARKDLGRVGVVRQKAQQCTQHGNEQHQHFRHAIGKGQRGHGQEDNAAHAGLHPVETGQHVGEIGGNGNTDGNEDENVKTAQVYDAEKGEIHAGAARCTNGDERHRGDERQQRLQPLGDAQQVVYDADEGNRVYGDDGGQHINQVEFKAEEGLEENRQHDTGAYACHDGQSAHLGHFGLRGLVHVLSGNAKPLEARDKEMGKDIARQKCQETGSHEIYFLDHAFTLLLSHRNRPFQKQRCPV